MLPVVACADVLNMRTPLGPDTILLGSTECGTRRMVNKSVDTPRQGLLTP